MGSKGYDGVIVTRSGEVPPNTVVVGIGGRKVQSSRSEEPPANTGTKIASAGILIPSEDPAQRLRYLTTVRDYLRTQLALVENQLDAES